MSKLPLCMCVMVSSLFWLSFFGLMAYNVYAATEGKTVQGLVGLNAALFIASLFSLIVVGSEVERLEKLEKEKNEE